MEVIFHVKGFGKIKSADINISNYALFVGNNNSGKTLLMELIYAVLNEIRYPGGKIVVDGDIDIEEVQKIWFEKEDIIRLFKSVNEFLAESLNEIVKDAFNTEEIRAESVQLEIKNVDEEYCIEKFDLESIDEVKEKYEFPEGWIESANDTMLEKPDRISVCLIKNNRVISAGTAPQKRYRSAIDLMVSSIVYDIVGVMPRKHKGSVLFLPAARTGFMMTYRPYFGKNDAKKGVTTPVHDFLSFLQEYAYTAKNASMNITLLDFIYSNLIGGKILETGDSTYYVPEGSERHVPLMLASSMVNELVPVTKMLTNYVRYNFMFYDEVETSLHPSKQIEMVRLLNRLNNAGMKMIVSTHSDAMARKINNMMMLKYDDRPFEEIQAALKRKGIILEREDVLEDAMHVYQFTNGEDGMSTVEELEFRETPLTGYAFPQFTDSAINLYEESKTVMGLDDGT